MLRRLTALLVVCVGLLGAAVPALACSIAALDGDCCPQNSQSSCTGSEPGERLETAATNCCIAAPVPSHAESISSIRSLQDEHPVSSATPDSLSLPPWIAPSAGRIRKDYVLTPVSSPPRTSAALTYLHTGRLRL